MKPEIKELIAISKYFGGNKDCIIGESGNVSFKNDSIIWHKAGDFTLSGLSEEGLIAVDRKKLRLISSEKYPEGIEVREKQVRLDLFKSVLNIEDKKHPAFEILLHNLINYKFTVHIHPVLLNGILCSRNAKSITEKLFGNKVLFVPYANPRYMLLEIMKSEMAKYRDVFLHDPQIILFENHGIFVAADTTDEIKQIYNDLLLQVNSVIVPFPAPETIPYNPALYHILPTIRMLLSPDKPVIIRCRNNSLIAESCKNRQEFHKISLPVTSDTIMYCKTRYMYVEQSSSVERIIESVRSQLPKFIDEHAFLPKILVIKDMGIFAIAESYTAAETALNSYENLIKITRYASQCGGIKLLSPEQIAFIDKWETEGCDRKISENAESDGNLKNKVAIITGGAQGFGAGIAEALYRKGANIIVADINEATGTNFILQLPSNKSTGKGLFVKTNVADPDSVKAMIRETVKEFGGLDIMISNAGILNAGGLDEMDAEVFSQMTSVNYNAYFYCAKYASEIMKIQNRENNDYFSDIIQINSKSGLRGSNRNFAYSGAKFGGIGLTQSFALELAPFKIKVNAVCPGNFYEGPLWSDPENGLFIQYLKSGKVPGAKNIDDVRKYYERQAPLKRGCTLEDVMKAIFYIIDQKYETGQAIPVTGGQTMLG
ncbi:MAG: SDR family NAD(P)-dependent oxidoreductase [Bacteroidales bacterium]|nr:SDR family NAD(P)-dependent oxidoreductase [Bacteroidales bacterium]